MRKIPMKIIHPSISIFSKNVNILRERKDLSYKELGRKAGLSGEMIKLLEKGIRSPSLNSALLICEALDTKLTIVLREENQIGELVCK
jgi:transcriptional regulator with XRE-family HTH domain